MRSPSSTPIDSNPKARGITGGAGASCALINLLDQAIEARLAALKLAPEQGDSLAEGINLRWLAHLYRFYTGEPASLSYARAAVRCWRNCRRSANWLRLQRLGLDIDAWRGAGGRRHLGRPGGRSRKQLDDAEALAAALNASSSARLRTTTIQSPGQN